MAHGVKRIVGAGMARFLHSSGWLARRRTPDQLPIVTFHRVLPGSRRDEYPLPGLAVTPEELSWLLGELSAHYTCGPLAGSFARWRSPVAGEAPPLAVTFDDCTADNHEHARPILAKHDVRASFFAPAGLIEAGEALWHDRLGFAISALATAGEPRLAAWLESRRLAAGSELAHRVIIAAKSQTPTTRAEWIRELEALAAGRQDPEWARLMTWDELGVLVADGHEVGSHSLSHELLSQLDPVSLRDEVVGSRTLIEQRLGRSVETFCYPNGDEDDRVAHAVLEAGYRIAVTTEGGLNETTADPMRLRRFDMKLDYVTNGSGAPSSALLLFRVSGHHPAANAR